MVKRSCTGDFEGAAARIQALWRGFACRTWLLDLRGPWDRLTTLYRVVAYGRLTYDVVLGAYRCREPGDLVRPVTSTTLR